jgi:hypothetical protein
VLPVLSRSAAALGAATHRGLRGRAGATSRSRGPRLVREYVTEVLPRAALTARAARTRCCPPSATADRPTTTARRRARGLTYRSRSRRSTAREREPPAPARAGVAALGDQRVAVRARDAGLTWVARRLPRRQAEDDDDDPGEIDDPIIDDAELALFIAAILACVVTSPTGWVMSFVWALPLAPLFWTAAGRARLSRRQLGCWARSGSPARCFR